MRTKFYSLLFKLWRTIQNRFKMKKMTKMGIPTIHAECTALTASYYKEYLGFKQVKQQASQCGTTYLLKDHENYLWLSPLEDHIDSQIVSSQRVYLLSSRIELDFAELREKVRVLQPLNANGSGRKTFTIIDCNGVELTYITSSFPLPSLQ